MNDKVSTPEPDDYSIARLRTSEGQSALYDQFEGAAWSEVRASGTPIAKGDIWATTVQPDELSPEARELARLMGIPLLENREFPGK